MRHLIHPFRDRPVLTLFGLVLIVVLGALGDLAEPLLPAMGLLAVLASIGLGIGVLLARRRPLAGWPHGLMLLMAMLLLGFVVIGGVQALAGGRRGFWGTHLPAVAAWQDATFGQTPRIAEPPEELRAALEDPNARIRERPASADELLYNAILLRAQDEPVQAARALADSLRRNPDPRPDALLMRDVLMASPTPGVTEALGGLPDDLHANARAHFDAMRLAEPKARAAAMTRIAEARPESMLALASQARALVAASLPQGPTIATARRIAEVAAAFADDARFDLFAAKFLQRAAATRLREEMVALAWTADVASRALAVEVVAPPPGTALPLLLHVTAPEPTMSLQYVNGEDAQGPLWIEVAQRQGDALPTIRVPRPFRQQTIRLRYLDRDGVTSPELAYELNPATAIREATVRSLRRQGPFGMYLPGRVGGPRLNPLAIAGQYRPGLTAVEWATDVDPRNIRVAPVGLPDDQVLVDGLPPRALVEFQVPAAARSLLLIAVFADGTRSATTELPIR